MTGTSSDRGLPWSDGGFPVVDVDLDDGPPAVSLPGIVLAAGASSRFDAGNKLLAEVDGVPVVCHSARTLVEAGLEPVVCVVGHEADAVRGALDALPVETVENPDYAAGQATSIRTGLAALPAGSRAVVIGLGDMPAVAPASVQRLLAAYDQGAGTALAAAVAGERGNPVLVDRRHFSYLCGREGDTGGRGLFAGQVDEDVAADAALVETGDPGVRLDVDDPADLERVRAHLKRDDA